MKTRLRKGRKCWAGRTERVRNCRGKIMVRGEGRGEGAPVTQAGILPAAHEEPVVEHRERMRRMEQQRETIRY